MSSALLLVRAMVATAASDGVVDPSQRVKIVSELKDGGLDAQAAEFLDAEIQPPRSMQSRRASDRRRSSLSRSTQRRISSPHPNRKSASLRISLQC